MAQNPPADEWTAIITASPHALVSIGPDGVVRACNPATARILGVESAAVVGRPFSSVLGFDDPGILAMLAQWPDMDHELRHTRGDGTAVEISLSVAPYGTADDPRAGYVAVFSDVTKRKLIDEHIRRSQRLEAIARLVGGVAHDFNNLLQVISGRAKLAKDAVRDGDDVRPHIEEIEAATKQASGHTRQLLAFSQRQELRPHVLRIDAVIRKAAPMLKRVVGPGIDLVINTGAADAQVTADQQQIERLLAHLALNARAAMPAGGTLTLASARLRVDSVFTARHPLVRPGEYVGICVSDTGVGMDEPTMLRLFEPFFTTREPGEGIGLGLATAFGIVKQSGGQIVAESEPGIGSTFRILFPHAPAARSAGPDQRTSKERVSRRSSGIRVKTPGEAVMIVEDTSSVRRVMALALAGQGFEIIEAADAEEALVKAAQAGNTLRVLVADVSLPGLSGVDLAQRIAASHPHTAVILISGYGVEHVPIERQIQDRTVVLAKPFSVPDFLRIVRQQADRAAKAAAGQTRRNGDKRARTRQWGDK